ncbi:D-altritol 5-dehydrogenase-like [Palaemon carinicauda]
MKALQWDKIAGKLSLINKDVPGAKDLTSGYILIKVAYAGICGTDLHIIQKEFRSADKVILGHEFSGTVVKIGPNVDHVKVGNKVVVDPNSHCDQCRFCYRGQPNFCSKGLAVSIGVCKDGGFSDYCLVPAKHVIKLPDSFPLDKGALCEPYSCIIRGWDNLGTISDDSQILILGAGIIGLLWASLFHHHGYYDVTITEISEGRRKLAMGLNLGYQVHHPDDVQRKFAGVDTGLEGYDIIVDCTGVPKAIESAFPLLRCGGKFCMFGCCPKVSEITINPADIMLKELTIVGSQVNPFTISKAVSLVNNMSERYLDFERLGIGFYSLEKYEEAMQMLKTGQISKAMFAFDN